MGRRWSIPDDCNTEVCAWDGDPIGHTTSGGEAHLIVTEHNAEVAALEAVIAKLKTEVEALQADAKLGHAVREFPTRAVRNQRDIILWAFWQQEEDKRFSVWASTRPGSISDIALHGWGATPEDALDMCGLMEDPEESKCHDNDE